MMNINNAKTFFLMILGLSLVWGLVSVWDNVMTQALNKWFNIDHETLEGAAMYALLFTLLALFVIHILNIDYEKFF
jgi:hypothetical protein